MLKLFLMLALSVSLFLTAFFLPKLSFAGSVILRYVDQMSEQDREELIQETEEIASCYGGSVAKAASIFIPSVTGTAVSVLAFREFWKNDVRIFRAVGIAAPVVAALSAIAIHASVDSYFQEKQEKETKLFLEWQEFIRTQEATKRAQMANDSLPPQSSLLE